MPSDKTSEGYSRSIQDSGTTQPTICSHLTANASGFRSSEEKKKAGEG